MLHITQKYLTSKYIYSLRQSWALSRSRSTGGPSRHFGVTAFTNIIKSKNRSRLTDDHLESSVS